MEKEMPELRKFVDMIQVIIWDPAHDYEWQARAALQAAFDSSEYRMFAAHFYDVFFRRYFKENALQLEAFELALKASDLSDESEDKTYARGLGAAALFLKEKSEDLHEEIARMLLDFGGRDGSAEGEPKLVPSWWANRGLWLKY